jgi:hypothetical protein
MRTRSRVPWPRTAHLRCRTSKSLPGLSEGVWGVDVAPHTFFLKVSRDASQAERARTKLSLPERTKADWPLMRGAFFFAPRKMRPADSPVPKGKGPGAPGPERG